MKRIRHLIILFALLLCASHLSLGLSYAEDLPRKVFLAGGEKYILSLEETTRIALQNSFEIQLAKYDTYISRTNEDIAESIYDAVIDAEVAYRDNQSKRTSSLAGTKTLENDYNVGVTQLLPSGTEVSVDMTNSRDWTDSSFVTLNPSHDSALGLSIKQSLGRNFFGIQDRGDVKLSRIEIENSQFTSLEEIEASLANVQIAYWDLVLQGERVAIREEMVEQAKKLFDFNQEQQQHGLAELPDVLAAEANYKTRINELILSEDNYKTKQNTLRLLINISDGDVALVPSEALVLSDKEEELDSSLKMAFENRYDYQRALKTIKYRDIKVSLEKNNLWPEIDLTASLKRNGVDDHFNQAIQKIFDEDNPDFSAGLTFSMPLVNTEARAKLTAAKLKQAQELIALKQLERKILIRVQDQVRRCNVLKEVAGNNVSVVDLQKRKLEEELKRFRQGRSDTDTLIRFQDDALLARIAGAEAKFRYHEALVELRKKEGTLLKKYWEGEL